MIDKILFNNEEYHIHENELPCLMTYTEETGGSHFSIVAIADMFLRGAKILFFTAYPAAFEDFMKQIGGDEENIAFVASEKDIENSQGVQMIVIESGNMKLFLDAVKMLDDIDERVLFVKNIETYSEEVFDMVLDQNNIFLSGNIDACTAREQMSVLEFTTYIAFSQPETQLPIEVPELPKWNGYMKSGEREGLVMLQMSEDKVS